VGLGIKEVAIKYLVYTSIVVVVETFEWDYLIYLFLIIELGAVFYILINMSTQTETEIKQAPSITIPSKSYAGSGHKVGPIEPMQVEDPGHTPEGNTTVFEVPDANEVKGKLFSIFWAIFTAGLNDAATGTLIPFLQPAYGVGLLEVAILYLINFVGWLLAAFSNVHLTSRIGQGGVLVVGGCLQTIAYALVFWKPPFPVFAMAYLFSGLGVVYQDAQANTFVANVANAHRWLGLMHAIYSLGAIIAPLVATTIAAQTPHWNYYYCIMLGLGVLDIGFLAWGFRASLLKPSSKSAKENANKDLKKALSSPVVWILSGFFFLYVGAEVTSGG
jgi:fucose permease